MNRIFLIITLFILLSSCIGKHNSDAQKATISEKSRDVESETIGDTIKIDLSKSNISLERN